MQEKNQISLEFSQRLMQVIESEGYSINSMEKALDLGQGTLSRVIKSGGNMGVDKVQKIANLIPGLDITWLITGKKSNVREYSSDGSSVNFNEPEASYGGKLIPYYDVSATAGNITIFNDDNLTEPVALLNVPAFRDCDFALNVHGDSMEGKYNSGDIIACKKINHTHFVNYGEAYLIVTEEQRLIKYLRKHKESDYYRLVSNNPEYDDIDMPKQQIKALFLVKGVIKVSAL